MTEQASRERREALLGRLGIGPSLSQLVGAALEAALSRAEVAPAGTGSGPREPFVTALDAGCGRHSALARYRGRIGRLVGADIHPPPPGALAGLDEFVRADLCGPPDAFAPATFDLALCSFTIEHLPDPAAALGNLAGWLRPGGSLVLTTVNRRHPLVAAYLGLPGAVRGRLQPLVKTAAVDAHPLVGACNDPASVRRALEKAGFADVRVETVGHLARAWGRRRSTFAVGVAGDLLARGLPSRRSTLVVSARVPEGPG